MTTWICGLLLRAASHKDDTGQTTAEFVGGFVVLGAIILALLMLVDPVREQAADLCRAVLSETRKGPG